MSQPFQTVEAAATRLQVHPKTVLRFIRDGRLRATRIGRAWRIHPSDLNALTGERDTRPLPQPSVRVTAIADLPEVSIDISQRLSTALQGLVMTRSEGRSPIQLETAYDPEQRRLKVIVVADALEVATVLQTLHAVAEAVR